MIIRIRSVSAVKVLDSRGSWTVEAEINSSRGSAPSGASAGSHEALCIPAENSVRIIHTRLRKLLLGKQLSQELVDSTLEDADGTPNLSKIGGNTAVAVSFAAHNAIKPRLKNVFPLPLGNVVGGGAHGGGTDFQEFLVLPKKAKSMEEAVGKNEDVYHRLKDILQKKKLLRGMNDEGALMTPLDNDKTLDLVSSAAEDVGCGVGLDVAASEFYKSGKYVYRNGRKLTSGEQIDYMAGMIKKYKLAYVEDGLHEDDFEGFAELTRKAGRKCLISGDDLFVTNADRLQKGIGMKACNSLIIKPNQAGTVSRAEKTVKLALKNKYVPVVSHRSAETRDTTISHLALEWGCPIIKAGVVDMRVTKLNELLRLWSAAKSPRMARL